MYKTITSGRGNDYGNENETFDGWLDDVNNYTGVVDKMDVEQPEVVVGAEGNRGSFAFEPAAIKVSRGTTVKWVWTGEGGYHNVVDEGSSFESDLVQEEGSTFTHTFDSSGVYKYACTPHEALGMKGVIVVE
ncbi:halocyanin domain-containing protein [Halospeciosus flavus]|uniref:Halocyanin domain-containing protein n=1 Tax=Halospeciosus flavus TaxID=3032283 RepID=A0ABD5Z2J8_9EURY